jgi:hypothetical protein
MGKITINAKTHVENLETKVIMDDEATIKELIRKVAPEFNFNPGSSVIMFRGEEVPPDKTLKEADIQDGFAVLILPLGLQKSITVTIRNVLGGDQASVRIEPDATVRHVLEEAASELNLDDMRRIIPIYNGNSLSLDQTLERAGITNDSIIILTPQMEELPEAPSQASQPMTPSQEVPHTIGSRTITPADEKFLREKLGEYKAKNDSLEHKIQKNFLIPKKVAYVLIVVAIISAILILSWPYLSAIVT